MKLSEFTLTVLKNFAVVNSGVVLKPGTVQKTISNDQSVMVEVDLPDAFPSEFGIYDLNQFLGNITTLNQPDLQFNNKIAVMDDGTMSMSYYSCSTELIDTPPSKELKMVDPDVVFDLPQSTLAKLLKLAIMNNLSHLSVIGENGDIKLTVHEKGNDTSNYASAIVGKTDKTFSMMFKTEKLKMIPNDYVVSIKEDKFGTFENTANKIKYFISLESKKKS